MFLKTTAVRTISEWNIHHFGIFHSLLETVAHRVFGIFSLYNSNGRSLVVIKHVVGILRLTSNHKIALKVNLTIRKFDLLFHRYIIKRPPFSKNAGGNVFEFNIFFRHEEHIIHRLPISLYYEKFSIISNCQYELFT